MVLLSIPIIALLNWLLPQAPDLIVRAPVFFSLSVIAFWVFVYALTIWQLVGVFRSASKRLATTQQKKPRFWARTAQTLVILGVLVDVNQLVVTAVPQILEFGRIALGDRHYSKYTIRVLHQGTELEILGGVSFGLTDDVQRHLITNPQIRLIHLNSIGGRIAEAQKLHELIVKKKLITYSSRGCQSACTIAFMGGTERYLYKNARLGFHRPTMPGLSDEEIEKSIEPYKADWRIAGVAPAFIEKAFSTPNKKMWEPTPEELLKAGVVTEVTDGADFAMSETGFGESHSDPASELSKLPLYATIKQYDPEGYDKLLQEFRKAYKGDYSRAELVARARNYTSQVFQRYAPQAADEPLIAMVRTIVQSLQYLKSQNAELCYAYLFPNSRMNPSAALSPELQERLMQTMTQVVESAATAQQPRPQEKQVNKTFEGIVSKLVARYGSDVAVLDQLNTPGVDHGKACTLTIATYEEVLRLPKKQSGEALRFMFMRAEP